MKPKPLTTFLPVILQSALEIMVNMVFMLLDGDVTTKGLERHTLLAAKSLLVSVGETTPAKTFCAVHWFPKAFIASRNAFPRTFMYMKLKQ